MQNRGADGFGARHQCGRIAPEERNNANAFVETGCEPLLLGKLQIEVHPERLGRQRACLPDLLPNRGEVRPPQHQHAESAGIADRGRKARPDGATQRRVDDRQLNSEALAKRCLHGVCSWLPPQWFFSPPPRRLNATRERPRRKPWPKPLRLPRLSPALSTPNRCRGSRPRPATR